MMNWLRRLLGMRSTSMPRSEASEYTIVDWLEEPGKEGGQDRQDTSPVAERPTQKLGGTRGGPRTPKRVVVLSDEEMVLLNKHSADPSRLAQMADEYRKGGKWKESFHCCNVLAKTFPDKAIGWRMAGIALYQMDESVWRERGHGLFEGPCENARLAVEYFDRALELDSNDHLTWYYRAHCLCHLGCINDNKSTLRHGLESFDEALRTAPGDPSTKKDRERFRAAYDQMA